MPLYDFECMGCHQQVEVMRPITDDPEYLACNKCDSLMRKVILPGHGGIKTDGDVPWLASAVKVLQPDHEQPIETRGEYNSYLKERGIIASG